MRLAPETHIAPAGAGAGAGTGTGTGAGAGAGVSLFRTDRDIPCRRALT